MGTYNCLFDDGTHLRFSVSVIDQFRDRCLEANPWLQASSSRISRCFWFDLLVLAEKYGLAVHEVLQSVRHLESGEPRNGIKLAAPFNHPPLKGLWHKHWFSARFMPANILAVTQKKNSMDWIWEIAKEGDDVTEELINEIAHRMTVGAFETRHAEKKITGEWIIYLPRAGVNYYLCLGTHQTGDDRLSEKIKTLCGRDFPELTSWIEAAAAD